MPSTKASDSCRRNDKPDRLGPSFPLFDALRQDPQSEHFCLRHGFVGCITVDKNARELRDLSNPPSVLFPLALET